LQDGDEVILRGWCERAGFRRIGFGECRGVVQPASLKAQTLPHVSPSLPAYGRIAPPLETRFSTNTSSHVTKAVCKTFVVLSFVVLGSWRVVSHPAYMNLYANDPRSKQELRTDCAICHAVDGKASDPNFLSGFGKAFKANRNRLSDELRERFSNLFNPADRPLSNAPVETVKLSTAQVVVNVTVTNAKGKYITGLDKEAFTLTEDGRAEEMVEFLGEDAPMAVAVLLDTSGSALEADMQKARNAVLDLAHRLRPNDVLAIFTFGEGGVQQIRDFSSSVRDLRPLLKQLKGGWQHAAL
jgi:hypothetical protein